MIKSLFKYLENMKFKILLLFILNFFVCLCQLIIPMITSLFLDDILTNQGEDILRIILVFPVLYIFLCIFSFYKNILYSKINLNMSFNIMNNIINHLENTDFMEISSINRAKISQQINIDSAEITQLFLNFILEFLSKIITIIIISVILARINFCLLLFCYCLIILYIINYYLFKKKLYDQQIVFKDKQSMFFSRFFDVVNNMKVIRIHNIKKMFTIKLYNIEKRLLETYLKCQSISSLYNTFNVIINMFSKIVLYIFSGYLLVKKTLSIGEFTLIINYFENMMASINTFLSLAESVPKIRASYTRITDLYALPLEKQGGVVLCKVDEIKVENLTFGYNDCLIIKDFYYTFKKNSIYAITGKNGIGKSTFFDLMLGLYNNYIDGNIYYNGINIQKIDLENLRGEMISFFSQKPDCLGMTVLENIVLNLEKYDSVNLKYFKEKLRFTLNDNYLLNGKVSNLSGGELAKVCLLRTLIKNAPILMFDEPTSYLDEIVTNNFIDIVKSIKQNHIVLIITHDLRVIRNADEVVELPDFKM